MGENDKRHEIATEKMIKDMIFVYDCFTFYLQRLLCVLV